MAMFDRRGITVQPRGSSATETEVPRADLAIKTPVRAATTANILLDGLQTIDGASLADGDRVLVKDQADTTQNGIYAAAAGGWSRTEDFDGTHEAVKGTIVFVNAGTVNSGTLWLVSASDPITPGATALTFSLLSLVANLTIGTTTISSGTDKGLLYDNGGILGNLATFAGGVLTTNASGVPSITANLALNGAASNGGGTITGLNTQNASTNWAIQNLSTGASALTSLLLTNSVSSFQFGLGGSGNTSNSSFFQNRGFLISGQLLSGIVIGTGSNGGTHTPLIFAQNTTTEVGRFLESSLGTLRLGLPGTTVGSLALGNVTSGTQSIIPATGALGTGVATLIAGTYNLVGDTLTQTLSNKTLASPTLTGTATVAAVAGTGDILVTNNQNNPSSFQVSNNSAGASATASYTAANGTNSFSFGIQGTGKTPSGFLAAGIGYIGNTGDLAIYSLGGKIVWSAAGSLAEQMRLSASGGFGVGVTTDPGAGSIAGSGGAQHAPPTTKTANYTQLVTDHSLIFNGAGSLTLTLLTASTYPGRQILIKTIATQTVVSNASNVVPQAGGAAGTAILAATAGKWAWLVSDGANWQIMASN